MAQHALTLICASSALIDGGNGVRFTTPVGAAFVLRYQGRLVAYLNRCAHIPVPLDLDDGRFYDLTRQFIICSMHGAQYHPHSGHCVGGPCAQGRLTPIPVTESQDQVYWIGSP